MTHPISDLYDWLLSLGMVEEYFTEAYGDVWEEYHSAVAKHGILRTPANPALDVRDSYIILAEEVGEVARAMTYDNGNDVELDKELVQVATMAIAMLVGLRLRREGGTT